MAAILQSKAFGEVTFKGLVPLLGHVIVTLEGEAHRQRRSLEGRLFVSSLLQKHERELLPVIISKVLEPCLQSGQGDLVEIAQNVTSRLAAVIIGLDGLNTNAASTEIVYLLSALVGGTSSAQSGQTPLTRPEAHSLLRQKYIDPSLSRRQKLIKQYQAGEISRNDLPSDLISLLLLHPEQWTIPEISAEVAFYAVAAVDTTATLIPHLMHELWAFIKAHPEHAPKLVDLNFLRAAATEALRLHPVLPTLFRQNLQTIEIEGNRFEPGEVVGLYLGRANRDESIFGPDATEFNPLRNVPPGVRRAGLSFGGGTHLCMGREVALGTPEANRGGETELFGEAALLAQALFQHSARPAPDFVAHTPKPRERNVYHFYPIFFN